MIRSVPPWPAPVRRRSGPLSYLEWGQGAPIVLLHGLSSTSASWAGVAQRLAPHLRVIAPDLLDFGASDAARGDGYMAEQAQAIRDLLYDLGVARPILAGHDFGGPVAVTLTRLFPELPIRGLVLSNTNMFTDTYVPPPLRTAGVPVLGPLVYKLMAGSRPGLWMTWWMAVARKDALGWADFSRDVDARNLAATQRIFQRSLADLETNYRPVQQQLQRTHVPALVLWGDRDPFFSCEVGRRTAAALADARFQVLEGTGHFAPQESPAGYADAILDAFGLR
jgi:pimeloyl-ACP methyl ester carboxylesterase